MEGEDRETLRSGMESAAMRELSSSTTIRDVVERVGTARLAEMMAGTADRTSRAFKAALRNAQRWRQGRRPRASTRQRVDEAVRRDVADRARQARKVAYKVKANWVTSRHEWEGVASGSLTGQDLRDWAAAVEAGDWEEAAAIQAGEYFQGGRDIVLAAEDPRDFEITIEE